MAIEFKDKKAQKHKLETIRAKEQEKAAKKTADYFNLPYINLSLKPVDPKALMLISEKEARASLLAIIKKQEKAVHVAIAEPKDSNAQDVIKRLEKQFEKVILYVTSPNSLEKAWSEYGKKWKKKKISGKVEILPDTLYKFKEKISNIAQLQKTLGELSSQKNVSVVVELLLASALSLNASDIHAEPGEEKIRLRLRIDGILHDISEFDSHIYKLLLSRIKLLSNLKLNVHNTAQDGRFSVDIDDIEIQIRTSIVPGEYGENIVLRVLNPQSLLSLHKLGIRKDLLDKLEEQINKPNGMLLTTGPTGSGKTTTLYAFLKKIKTPRIKIITIEDPIEYHIKGLTQTQVKPEEGYTFANGLRSALRQDPDVILVGEVRDLETADTAIQAALTGHLVLSSLHTNDAAGVISRLVDIGANPSTIGPALNAAIAQRLIRRVCQKCRKQRKITKKELDLLTKEFESNKEKLQTTPRISALLEKLQNGLEIADAKGCEECNNTGYKGRVGIYEILIVTPEFEKFILQNPSIAEIRGFAKEKGLTTLRQDAFLKVIEGLTTIEEAQRVTGKN